MDQKDFHDFLSGAKNGPIAILVFQLLQFASRLYRLVIALRNFCYRNRLFRTYRITPAGNRTSDKLQARVPVISVGNLTTGGTGKTPLVIWLASYLKQKKVKCAILTRGYKTAKGKLSDEPAILARNCPEAAVIVNPNRIAGAIKAVRSFDAETLIMDDGFQHRRLARDLDIVTIDAARPFGYGRLLPAGLLREPAAELKRADAVVITKCDQIPRYKLSRLKEKLRRYNGDIPIAETVHEPVCAKTIGAKKIMLAQLRAKNIFAFCGIANPSAFISTIKRLGFNLSGSEIFDDHHSYTRDDITEIFTQAALVNADLILTTEKDWSKTALPASAGNDIAFAYLAIELKFVGEQEQIIRLIENALAGKIQRNLES